MRDAQNWLNSATTRCVPRSRGAHISWPGIRRRGATNVSTGNRRRLHIIQIYYASICSENTRIRSDDLGSGRAAGCLGFEKKIRRKHVYTKLVSCPVCCTSNRHGMKITTDQTRTPHACALSFESGACAGACCIFCPIVFAFL